MYEEIAISLLSAWSLFESSSPKFDNEMLMREALSTISENNGKIQLGRFWRNYLSFIKSSVLFIDSSDSLFLFLFRVSRAIEDA